MKNRLENALDYIAACIAQGDESLLPIFERLDAELETIQAQQSTKEKALARVTARASAASHAQPAM